MDTDKILYRIYRLGLGLGLGLGLLIDLFTTDSPQTNNPNRALDPAAMTTHEQLSMNLEMLRCRYPMSQVLALTLTIRHEI